MPKSKREMMRRNYAEHKAAGLVRLYFWVPKETKQIVKDAVEGAVAAWRGKKKRFWS